MIYGHDKTWHKTGHLDVETDEHGNVVSVWFRCMMLPFKQVQVGKERAESMIKTQGRLGTIKAVDIDLKEEECK